MPNTVSKVLTGQQAIEVNQVLRNTYLLLSLTLLWSAAVAYYAFISNAAPVGIILLLVAMFGFPALIYMTQNSGWGIMWLFAYTGFLGYVLGPILNLYIKGFENGPQLVATSIGATGLIFLGLSAYALTSRKNYSYLGGFICMAALAAFVLGLGSIFFNMPILNLVISGAFALISSAYILYTTSAIIHGGERNYITATLTLYIAIFNLFLSLLRILSFFAGSRR